MDISPATVKRHWTVARAWLARELERRPERVTAERWRQINELFHAALERDAGRARRLHCATPGRTMRTCCAKCRRLLDSHGRSSGFLEEPAWAVAADLILDDDASLAGKTIGKYRVVAEIARGGMGVVYLRATIRSSAARWR